MKNKTTAIRAIACAAFAACATGASANGVAYYYPGFDFDQAYLVDWNTAKHTARVAQRLGNSTGTYTDDGTQRVVTLATPISEVLDTFDSCGDEVTQTTTTTQLVFRPAGAPKKGTAQFVPIGTVTTVGGCAPGTVPFGSTSDAGTTLSRLDMTLRPSTADLANAQLAGPGETPMAGASDSNGFVAQIAVFDGAANLSSFVESGDFVTSTNVNGWIVVNYPDGHQSGYTRLAQDATSGIETWLEAPWANNAPIAVHNALMTKVDGSGGWAGTKGAARNWFEAIFANSDTLPYFDLLRDHTGNFVQAAADGSFQSTMPATWTFEGANLQIQRSYDFSTGFRQRTWVPLANHGKNHFVLEHEDRYDADGNFTGNNILPRVNYYVDEGPGTQPATAKTTARPRVLAHRAKP